MNNLSKPMQNYGIYQLNDINQVYEKAKSLIESAEEYVLIDAFPEPLKQINSTIIEHNKIKKIV